MKRTNVNDLDIVTMIRTAEVTVGVLYVVDALQKDEGYTRAEAAQDLINCLHGMGYLKDPLEVKKVKGINDER